MLLLAIESSCDDTSAAIVRDGKLLSNTVASQREHAEWGGVVPELASRAHQQRIVPVVQAALDEAGVTKHDLNAVAVTYGPGLAGSLLVGLSFAKALALGLDLPLIGVNHLEGHIYSVFLGDSVPSFPYLCLTVSGGHSQLVKVEEGFRHTLLGTTRDDAAGEAFDKVGKLLGLPYPAGPVVDKLARQGNSTFHEFTRTFLPGYDFSFSGIKTNVLYYLNALGRDERERLLEQHMPDIAASFQAAVVDMLMDVVRRSVRDTGIRHLAIVGGVSANSGLRAAAEQFAQEEGIALYVPPLRFCMDNAAMIGVTAHFKLEAGYTSPMTLKAEPALKV